MPTYEYLCQTCSHRFETWQKMTDEPLTICPECGGHIRRVFYPAGLVFKGHGFYKTDHGNGVVPATTSTSDGSTGGEGSHESKSASESKAAENGSATKASENGTSKKSSESSTSTASAK